MRTPLSLLTLALIVILLAAALVAHMLHDADSGRTLLALPIR